MRSTDVQDELAEGFEPTELPPPGPDGSLELPPMREAPPPPPRLCEAGPCRHYHTFLIQMDAAKPLAVRRPDGSSEQAMTPDRTERHHYCYPNPGIEMKLGGLPVIQCNRWAPIPADELAIMDDAADLWLTSTPAGQKFTAELDAWRAANAALEAEQAAAIDQAAADLANMPEPVVRVYVIAPQCGYSTCFERPWTTPIGELLSNACSAIRETGQSKYLDDFKAPRLLQGVQTLEHEGKELDLSATLSHAGISNGDRILLTLRETP